MAWDDLPTLDATELAAFYDEEVDPTRDAAAELKSNRRLVRKATKRTFAKAEAARLLERLPAPDESFHCVMAAHVDGWSLVPAVLELCSPAKLRRLWVATLGFNRDNAIELFGDRKQIERVEFVCSCYFRSVDVDVYEFVQTGLACRGQRIAAVRSHAKLLLFELTDGRGLVVESSANLRSCRNVEQFCLTHSRALLEFHAAWMEEFLSKVTPPAKPRRRGPAK